MTNKKTEKMCKEIDEEGYYHYIQNRDKKHFGWILNLLRAEKLQKRILYLLHMTGLHTMSRIFKQVEIDENLVYFYTCKTCGYECSVTGIKWEVVKYFLTWIGILGFVLVPYKDFLSPSFIPGNILLLLIFFILVHISAGIRGCGECMLEP